jgi:hypothetical protein
MSVFFVCIIYFVYVIYFSRNSLLTKNLMLKIDSAASSGGQGKLIYFAYFPWPSLEAGLSISTFCFLVTRCRKLLFLVCTLLMIRRSPK